jgi:hypothetical protein
MTTNTFACNFCKKSYTSQSNLNNHQKTAKFCLDLQNKLTSGELIRCEFCLKEFTTKKYLNQHNEICKQRKNVEQNDLKKELENYKKELENYKKENSELKVKLELKDEMIKKLEKQNKDLINRPSTTTTINNNDNRQQNQYNIQFNQLFEKLPILNEENVNNRINELSTEEKVNQYDLNNFYKGALENIIYQLKDFSFCTDSSRKMVVIKDETEKSVKLNAEEFLSKSFTLGSESIKNHITFTDQIVNDRIDNYDPIITSEMLDLFNDDRDKFRERLKNNKENFFTSTLNNRIESGIVSGCIKQLEKCGK